MQMGGKCCRWAAEGGTAPEHVRAALLQVLLQALQRQPRLLPLQPAQCRLLLRQRVHALLLWCCCASAYMRSLYWFAVCGEARNRNSVVCEVTVGLDNRRRTTSPELVVFAVITSPIV